MPRRYEVEQHPEKKRIIKALVRGESYRDIAERFGGLSRAALSRYLNKKLLPQIGEAMREGANRDGSLALTEIQDALDRIHKMYRACDEYLAHPDKPGEYFLGPRGEEIIISYMEEGSDGEWHSRTESLQAALSRLQKAGKIPVNWRYKHADPRKLVLETMSKAKEQIELMARATGKIQDIVVNVAAIEQWTEIKIAIIEAIKDMPDARDRIVEALKEIAGAGSDQHS